MPIWRTSPRAARGRTPVITKLLMKRGRPGFYFMVSRLLSKPCTDKNTGQSRHIHTQHYVLSGSIIEPAPLCTGSFANVEPTTLAPSSSGGGGEGGGKFSGGGVNCRMSTGG